MKFEKKIAFIISGLRKGGAEKVCVGLINEFFNKGYSVDLIVLNLNDSSLLKNLNPSIKLIDLNVQNSRSAFFKLKRVVYNYNICLVFNFQLTVMLVVMKYLYQLKMLIVSRGINTFSEKIKNEKNFRHKYFNSFLIRKFYKKADVFIAQSSGMKSDMITSMGISESKIVRIFNPNFSFENGKEAIPYNDSLQQKMVQKELLFVGSLKEQKNLPFLLQTLYELLKIRQDVFLRIVGGGDKLESLMLIVEQLDISDHVSFEGAQDNVGTYYRKADVFLLSSWYEGFPNVILEALSYGLPTVSINCKSGPEDIIVDDINGYLVHKYDPVLFSKAINSALSKEWDKRQIKESLSKFSFNTIFHQYEYTLNNCIVKHD